MKIGTQLWERLLTVVKTGVTLREFKPYLKGSTNHYYVGIWIYYCDKSDFSQEAGNPE